MKVICPECNFASEIPEDKIPANAQLATCPRCQIKFRFRNLDEDQNDDAEIASKSLHQSENAEYSAQINTTENGFPPQQAPADSTQVHQHEQVETDQDEISSQEVYQEQANKDENPDIWKSLDSMSPEENIENEKAQAKYVAPDNNEVPFEAMEKYGFFPAIFLTIKKVILSPNTFFKDMKLTGFIKPLIFFVLLAEFQEICNFIWATAGVDSSIGSDVGQIVGNSVIANSLSDGTASAMLSLFLYPLMLAGLSFPIIGVTHVLLMIFGAGERGFQATYRATAYSYAPIILCVIPIVGDMLGALVSLVISIIAYRNIHNTSYMRVVLSMIMPAVLLLVIFGLFSSFNQPTI